MTGTLVLTEAPEHVPATAIAAYTPVGLSAIVTTLPDTKHTPPVTASIVMAAMGVRNEANGKARHDNDDSILLPIWLTAHRVKWLVIAAPQHVKTASLLALIDLCVNTPTTVVLACDHGYLAATAARLASQAPRILSWDKTQLLFSRQPKQVDQAQEGPTRDQHNSAWQPEIARRLPDNEFFTFYAACKRLLDAQTFAQVDVLYRDTLGRILNWLDELGPDHITKEAAITAMTELLNEQATLDDVAVITNAVQAGFFRRGWLFNIDHREMRSALLRHPGPQVSDHTWQRLRAYRDPARSAAIALFLAGLTPGTIRHLTVTDLAAWHAAPANPLAGTVIPKHAGPYLRAQLLARTIAGCQPNDPLFMGTKNRVLIDLRDAQADLGINFGDSKIVADEPFGNRHTPGTAYVLERIS